MFNRSPKYIRMLSSCSVNSLKSELDSYLMNIVDLPCQAGFNNSLDDGDCLHGGHYADDIAAKQTEVNRSKVRLPRRLWQSAQCGTGQVNRNSIQLALCSRRTLQNIRAIWP